MTECSGCGDCCRVVTIGYTKAEVRSMNLHPADRRWILQDLRRITRAEALRRLPSLEGLHTGAVYECRQFDPETNACRAYAERPPVCSAYPFYGRAPSAQTLKGRPRCSFWADVPAQEWPDGFIPLCNKALTDPPGHVLR